jgi:carboxymethylenebutenolidase
VTAFTHDVTMDALFQVGLLDPEGLPVAGVEQARRLLDKHLPTNVLMATGASSP